MKRPTNTTLAAGIGTTEPNAASWETYDRLPHAVRELLWGAPVSINPLSVEALARDGDFDEAIAVLIGAIMAEIRKFDQQHRRAHGYPLPAVASGVAPLRYGLAVVRRRAMRFSTRPILRRRG